MFYGYWKPTGSFWNCTYVWQPNLRLEMSAAEQYKANKAADPDFQRIKVMKPVARAVVA